MHLEQFGMRNERLLTQTKHMLDRRQPDDGCPAVILQRERAVILGKAFAQPRRDLARDAGDHDVRVLVEDRAQRETPLVEGKRDDVLIG